MSMDSNGRESSDTKAEFRKPSNDAGNRKYRRRSPIGGSSSSSDGSPHRGRSSSPVPLRKNIAKFADDKRKRDDDRNLSGRNDESYKHSDRLTSRSHHRHDDHSRRERHVDDYDRGYSKSSYRSSRDSRDNDYSRSDKEHRSRDSVNDTYSRAKYDGSGYRGRDKDSYDRSGSGRKHATIDERVRDRDRHREDKGDRYGKTDHRNSSGDHRNDLSPVHEEARGQRNDFSARRDNTARRDTKDLDCERPADKRRNHDHGSYKEQGTGEAKEHSDDISKKGQDSVTKKPKFVDSTGPGADGTSEQGYVKDSDIDAAKVAAMKAAELVNKNLVGTGYMSTDQKKKLLWGNKTTTIEESTHRWDTTTFGDRERQEKFNKLMSLRCIGGHVGREGGGKGGVQTRQPRCGKAARAASDGIGEAIHSWIASERWSDCWTWSLGFFFRYYHAYIDAFPGITMYCMTKLLCEMRNVGHVVISFNLACKLARFLMLLILTMLEIIRVLLSFRSGLSYFCRSYHMLCSHCFAYLVKFGILILYCGMSLAF